MFLNAFKRISRNCFRLLDNVLQKVFKYNLLSTSEGNSLHAVQQKQLILNSTFVIPVKK